MELYDLTKMLNSNCPSYFASTPNHYLCEVNNYLIFECIVRIYTPNTFKKY